MSGKLKVPSEEKIQTMIEFVVKFDNEVSRIAAAEPLNERRREKACLILAQEMKLKPDSIRRQFGRYKKRLAAVGRLPHLNESRGRYSKEVESLVMVACAYLSSQSMPATSSFIVDNVMMKIPEVCAQAAAARDPVKFRARLVKWFNRFTERNDVKNILKPSNPKPLSKSRAADAKVVIAGRGGVCREISVVLHEHRRAEAR
jgi:hypothetical protein